MADVSSREPGTIAVASVDVADGLVRALEGAGHRVEALRRDSLLDENRDSESIDLILLGVGGGGAWTAGTVADVKRRHPSTPVAAVISSPTAEMAIAAFHEGAWDVLIHPVSRERALALASRAAEVREKGRARRRVAEDLVRERECVQDLRRRIGEDDPFSRLLGTSGAVRSLIETLREVARTDATVLIRGESGTGKGLVARAIHDASARAAGPFVEANCVVFSEGILHSELFGHEKGAFTGASRQKKGRFELAGGGTIFLDEIGEISPATQLLLLRVLQDRSFERVGGEQTLTTDCRLIAATNADLEAAIRRGTFRNDLYYRLNVIPVHVPPLRDHREDVPLLATEFLRRFAGRTGREMEGFAPEVVDRLTRHDWPGNVRELENLVERLAVLTRSQMIRIEDLPETLRGPRPAFLRGNSTLRSMEVDQIVEVLRQCGGNKKLAATRLGIHRATLYAKLRRYGIEAEAHEARRNGREPVGAGRT